MGDRTYVELTVLREHWNPARNICEEVFVLPQQDNADDTHACLGFDEVNYGEIPEELCAALRAGGIPFDWRWGSGSGYGPGRITLRFTPEGELQYLDVNDSEIGIPVMDLMSIINEDISEDIRFERLVDKITAHHERVTPLSWENQAEYGKVHRAKQLIKPT